MARRMICALLLSLCLTACGTGQTEPSSELPQESLLEQESDQAEQDAQTLAEEEPMLKITVGDYALTAVFEDNSSAEEFRELLAQGPVTVEMEDYGGFEKVGSLGQSLPTSNTHITTQSGDIVLYQGNQIVLFYGSNAWSYTPLGQVTDLTGWQEALGHGDVTVTFSLTAPH